MIHVKSRERCIDLLWCPTLWCIPCECILKRLQWPLWISQSCENYSSHARRLKTLCEETPSSHYTIWPRLVRNDCNWTSNMSACQSAEDKDFLISPSPVWLSADLKLLKACVHIHNIFKAQLLDLESCTGYRHRLHLFWL